MVTSVYLVCLDLYFKHTSAIVFSSHGLSTDVLEDLLVIVPSQVRQAAEPVHGYTCRRVCVVAPRR